MPSDPDISVIIVSYNTRQMTLDCLAALMADLGSRIAEVFVVDNGSTDSSAAAIRAAWPGVRLIENTQNVGFGRANNQALEQARGHFVLLLNSDTSVKAGAIGALIDYLQTHGEVAVVGPRLLNADGTTQRSCFRFPTPARAWLENLWIASLFGNNRILGDYRRWPHDQERLVDWVIGACLLVRADVCRSVGGFDPRFFMYSEEADWQRRIRDAGHQVAFTPKAQVTHLGGASGGTDRARINRYFFDSLDYYELKHHGLVGLVLLRLAMAVGCFVRFWLWLGALCLSPRRRQLAGAKARLHGWLFFRQLTHWPPQSVR